MRFLKEDTITTVQFGPFVDKTDGVTLEVGLATAMDNATTGIRVSKNGAAFADRDSATAPSYDAMGCYRVALSATDTSDVGVVRIIFEESATCLPHWEDFMVMPGNVYDSMFGTDTLQVDVTQVGGATTNVAAMATNVDAILTDTGTTLDDHLTDIKGTGFVKDTHSLIDIETYVDILDDGTSGNVKIATDVAAVLVDTGTTLDGHLTDIKGTGFVKDTHSLIDIETYVDILDDGTSGNVKIATDVAAVLVDTGTTLDDHLTDIKGTGFVKDTHSLIDIETYVDILDDGTSGNVKIATDVAAVLVDTGTTLDGKLNTAQSDLDIITDTDGVILGAAGVGLITANTIDANIVQISGNATSADNLKASTLAITVSAVNDASASTTAFIADLTEVTNDHYNTQVVCFTSGNLAGQKSDITDYDGATKTITVTALTEAPADNDVFVIV